MKEAHLIRPVAHIYTDFSQRFGIPRQSGLVPELTAQVVFDEEFRDINAVKGIEGYSCLWLIWGFSETVIDMEEKPVKWAATVAPPRLGGKIRMGVFATRSPYRPNSLGLSCVNLLRVDYDHPKAPVLWVAGADILNGTPVYDIKPYVAYADSRPDARSGFAVSQRSFLDVSFPQRLLDRIPEEKRRALLEILAQDPRGSYEKQPGFVYGLNFAGYDIRFTVQDAKLEVFEVIKADDGTMYEKIK